MCVCVLCMCVLYNILKVFPYSPYNATVYYCVVYIRQPSVLHIHVGCTESLASSTFSKISYYQTNFIVDIKLTFDKRNKKNRMKKFEVGVFR